VKREKIANIVREASANGINYFDLVWSLPTVLQGVADGIEGQREKAHLIVHLGSGQLNGSYKRSRKPGECERYFDDALRTLRTNYADVANVHYVKDLGVWKEVKESGVVDLAVRLRDSGRARAVGISTHDTEVIRLAVETGIIDVVTYQVNMANHKLPGRDDTLKMCAERGVGVVAMKPFAGGKLLQHKRKVKIAKYQTGGITVDTKIPAGVTPIKCLSYVLSQPGVCTTITGVSSPDELHSVLAYPDASHGEKDYSQVLKELL
jgi:predicted aldo/keto reductase-like oxidoreductase